MECTANDNTSEKPHMRSEVEVEHNTSDGNANAHMGETDLNVENLVKRPSSESQQPASVDPYVGVEFDSDEATKSFCNRYARRAGFSIRTSLRSKAAALMRKDRGGATAASLSWGCFEMKPFIATLVILTLVIALYQLALPTPSNPNKHIFPAYGNATTLFVRP
ncbi:hypothetical protein MRB53_002316 [Persea americana]|uniref:Uncharacterized protein n=1 Tax=Persea americana TaxID=3435 RepID=A0ACC2MUV3_PERAE|nr:hypothetical protein MRB53_002316 [Persea americana]